MNLYISSGCGVGPTEISAFDKALLEAGVGNLNLIPLSSVLPIGSNVVHGKPSIAPEHFGSRLYCVLSQKRTSSVGSEVWAGIGWVQDSETGQGLFVEHNGSSKAEVEMDIRNSLTLMTKERPDRKWLELEMITKGIKCDGEPVCALVVASYEVQGWGDSATPQAL